VDGIYNNAIDKINRWVEEEERKKHNGPTITTTTTVRYIRKKIVNKQTAMNVPFSKPRLETKEDVAQYVEALRKQLEGYIDQDNYIMLN
jgi:hypothetical protein